MKEHRYRSGEDLAEFGDICEFDFETRRVHGIKRPGEPVEHWDTEKGTQGEVVKLLPGGKLRIKFEHPNPGRGERRIQTAIRPANECELSERTM